jgi:methanogenic corrinoid protein MtbC1
MSAVRHKDEGVSRKVIAKLLSEGHTPSTLLMELITPAAREFGRMWEDDTCDFFEVTLASGRLQTLIHELRDQMARTSLAEGRSVLLCGLPGEDHTLGLSILAEFFTLHGWSVSVGPPFLDADPAVLASQAWYDVIGFSVARDEAVIPLKHFVSRTRRNSLNKSVTIMVGGRAIDADPGAISLVGADTGGIAAAEAVRSAASLQNREKE